ncbi:DUF3450 family protein [Aidingimonas lacisalsi]|uniref:DUF3450 family protein n=1 Tax=Aidingimonas lacisalsi TaxID=2604086 RepID=UPI0013760E96|nr:DUF3450 family protein [Aidingimonas lacisalsi]
MTVAVLWCLSLSVAVAQEDDRPYVDITALAWMSPLMLELTESVEALETFVEADMPFLRDERQARVDALKRQLETTGASPRLYQRLLSAWRSELDYGREMDSWRGLLVGNDQREVDYLRVGRIGLYYLTPDGNKAGVWKVSEQAWQPLEGDDLSELRTAIQVVRERRAPELLTLPLSIDTAPSPRVEVDTTAAKLLSASTGDRLLSQSDIDSMSSHAAQVAGDLRDSLTGDWLLYGGSASLPPRLSPQGGSSVDAVMVLSGLRSLAEESGRVRRFSAEVADDSGEIASRDVMRLGGVQAVAGGDLLSLSDDADGRQDTARFRAVDGLPSTASKQVQAFFSGEGDRVPLDPSDGRVLEALAQQPSLLERFQQGGVVGYVIVGLGGLGLLVALAQYLYLLRVSMLLRRQLRNLERLRSDNPLGRVLKRFRSLQAGHSPEALEARLDEALLAEQPRLERGQPLVKLLAAVAPLLGLLGTVTGMIVTFQSITVYGTGDPQLMAGGISQALVTTVLGLITAVPLLFAHTALSSRSRRLIGVLEGRSSAVLANHLETRITEATAETTTDAHALV